MRQLLVLGLVAAAVSCAAVVHEPAIDPDEPALPPARGVMVVPEAAAPLDAEPIESDASTDTRECIDDVVADAVHRGRTNDVFSIPSGQAAQLTREELEDLDRDGMPEQIVTYSLDCGATGNCPWLIYLSSAGCPMFAGSFWSAYHDRLARTRKGVHDLQTWTKGGCAGLEGTFTQLGWNGTSFEPVASINCDCNIDDPQRDPECPSVE